MKRGKILRDTSIGPGLLVADGKQYPFSLEGMWKSELPPRVGMTVQVAFAGDDISHLEPVPEAQLAREQADLALAAARTNGARLANGLVAALGLPMLLAMGALFIGWFVLNTVSVNVGPGFQVGMSFWKLLAVLNTPLTSLDSLGAGGGSSGIYGVLAAAALLAPLASLWWRDPRAHLGGAMPLLFMIVVFAIGYNNVSSAMDQAQEAASAFGGGRYLAEISEAMVQRALKAVSIGAGFYLSAAASLYLAARAVTKFLAAKAG